MDGSDCEGFTAPTGFDGARALCILVDRESLSSQLNCQLLGQIARSWNVRLKKKNNKQTNEQKEQNEPFSFTKVHNFKFFNNNSSNSLKIHFICLVK